MNAATERRNAHPEMKPCPAANAAYPNQIRNQIRMWAQATGSVEIRDMVTIKQKTSGVVTIGLVIVCAEDHEDKVRWKFFEFIDAFRREHGPTASHIRFAHTVLPTDAAELGDMFIKRLQDQVKDEEEAAA